MTSNLSSKIVLLLAQTKRRFESAQQSDGSYLSYSSPSKSKFEKEKIYKTIFTNSLVLYCLSSIPEYQEESFTHTVATFLYKERSESWTWNYWVKDSDEYRTLPYPDDADDTHCVLSALHTYDPARISGSAFASIITSLTHIESAPGGPYKTWYTSAGAPQIWQDIDIAVNSNIAYFLSLRDIHLDGLTSWIDSRIELNSLNSPYYPNSIPILFFISRGYQGQHKNTLIRIIQDCLLQTEYSGSPLYTSLCVISLLTLGVSPSALKHHIQFIISEIDNDNIQAEAFCIDPAYNNTTYYGGCEILTISFCFYALSLFKETCSQAKQRRQDNESLLAAEQFKSEIVDTVKNRLAEFSDHQAYIDKVAENAPRLQAVLFPYYFHKALQPRYADASLPSLKPTCCLQLLGWIAYTILDDVIDDKTNIQLVPLSSVCLVHLSTICMTELIFEREQQILIEYIQTMEVCNLELSKHHAYSIDGSILTPPPPAKLHYPTEYLYKKSCAHMLGVLILTIRSGFGKGSTPFKTIEQCIQHYLIARQLNDDAHDWYQDMQKGISNYTNTLVLQKFLTKYPTISTVNIFVCKQELEHLFWKDVIPYITAEILLHTQKAREYLHSLQQLSIFSDISHIELLLCDQEQAAKKALKESSFLLDFLTEYEQLHTR